MFMELALAELDLLPVLMVVQLLVLVVEAGLELREPEPAFQEMGLLV